MIFLSASQITLFRECQRKWGWRYLANIKTPQHPAAALGTEVDDTQLQPYLRDGRPFDFTRPSGEIAASLLPFLPAPQSPGLVVQRHFQMPSPTWRDGKHIGFGFQGFEDLWLPDSGVVPGLPGGAPFVGDFKTTSDLKWAKSEAQLKTDVQAMLYAMDAMYATRANAVDLAWMYAQTKNARKSKRTYLRVVADHVAEQFGKINETALEMLGVRIANPHPTELPPNPEQCEAYGGCPHRDKCFPHLSPAKIIDAFEAKESRAFTFGEPMSNTTNPLANPTMNLLAQLKAQVPGAAAAMPALIPPPTPVAAPPSLLPPVAPTAPQISLLPPVAAPALAPAVVQATTPPVATPAELAAYIAQNPRAAFLLEQPAPQIVGINPPESLLPPAPATGVTQAAPVQAPAEAPKRGRGRPPKAKPDPIGADANAFAQAPPAGGEVIEVPVARTYDVTVDTTEIVRVAKAVRAGLDAFLASLGAS